MGRRRRGRKTLLNGAAVAAELEYREEKGKWRGGGRREDGRREAGRHYFRITSFSTFVRKKPPAFFCHSVCIVVVAAELVCDVWARSFISP